MISVSSNKWDFPYKIMTETARLGHDHSIKMYPDWTYILIPSIPFPQIVGSGRWFQEVASSCLCEIDVYLLHVWHQERCGFTDLLLAVVSMKLITKKVSVCGEYKVSKYLAGECSL